VSAPHEPIDQVLDAIDGLLGQRGTRWVDSRAVREQLKWSEERLQEVADLMTELCWNGDIRCGIVAYGALAGRAWPAELGGRPAAETVWAFLSAFRVPS
jgi:hypothetical protein